MKDWDWKSTAKSKKSQFCSTTRGLYGNIYNWRYFEHYRVAEQIADF